MLLHKSICYWQTAHSGMNCVVAACRSFCIAQSNDDKVLLYLIYGIYNNILVCYITSNFLAVA